MSLATCLIPAAGIGLRAKPHTEQIPKPLLRVGGKPLIHRTIELVVDQLGIHSFVVVTGHLGAMIRDYIDGLNLDIHIEYIENTDIEKGLSWSILLARKLIQHDFLTILSDEFYHNTNHTQFCGALEGNALGRCGAFTMENENIIRQNYTMEVSDNQIISMKEKPVNPTTQLMGCGSFIFTPEIFHELEKAFFDHHCPDFIGLLDKLCRAGHRLESFHLTGEYVNVNDLEALKRANDILENS